LKAEVRFLAWFGVASALSLFTASNFVTLLDQSLGDTFGSIFPAIPFAALLSLILALRWSELKGVLAVEGSIVSQPVTRLFGLTIVVALLALRALTAQTVEASGIALVLTFYGTSLVMNPLTKSFMLPYAAVCAVGVGAPGALQWVFGEPLAGLSSGLSAAMVGLAGLPVSWQGTQFELISKTGEVVTGAVTPGCSSIISVTTFLGLLALMHLDLKKDMRSTGILAIAGVGFLTVLNSVRILVLMWVGYEGGAASFWGVHNWIGYAIFLGFYLVSLPIYSRMGRVPVGFYPGKTVTP
jgi:exosortase/archaeosortase family protein